MCGASIWSAGCPPSEGLYKKDPNAVVCQTPKPISKLGLEPNEATPPVEESLVLTNDGDNGAE